MSNQKHSDIKKQKGDGYIYLAITGIFAILILIAFLCFFAMKEIFSPYLNYEEQKVAIQENFIPAGKATYKITNKGEFMSMTILNVETKEAYYISADNTMYYQLAPGDTFEMINSRDGMSMKSLDKDTYFILDKIDYLE